MSVFVPPNLQEVLELCGCVDEVGQAALNLGLVTGTGPLTEQLGAVVLHTESKTLNQVEEYEEIRGT